MRTWLLGISLLPTAYGASCRCEPGQDCWPTVDNWASLNSSIDGNLVAVRPLGAPCHVPDYNAAECAIIEANSHSSSYRSSFAGALQYQNWGAWPAEDEECYVGSPKSVPCAQGRIPLYAAQVESAQHIQAAVNFASQHNLKLVIKNSGHDLLGRSSGPRSLQIFTHKLKSMDVIDSFVPSVPDDAIPPSGVKAVTFGAGVQLHEMYAYLGSKGVMVVGGSASTVGVSGGYIQGGGHSVLGWLHGMASDNAIEFQVVLADGTLVLANAYQNTDLFYALRGGGGGSFGVVVSVTVNAFPDYPVVFARANYTTETPSADFWKGIEATHAHLAEINNHGGSGYYKITPYTPVSNSKTVSTFEVQIFFVNHTNPSVLTPYLPALLSSINSTTALSPSYTVIPFPTLSSMYAALFTGNDTTGILGQVGSRLISRSFFDSPTAPKEITTALSDLKLRAGDYIQGCLVAGGQVARNGGIIESGLNPSWRETMLHILFTRVWSATTSFADQETITTNITEEQVPLLKALEPQKAMGAYLNEADANEPHFQSSFWGETYDKLKGIKERRDPGGLFIARKGVGSEEWDEDGLCRVE